MIPIHVALLMIVQQISQYVQQNAVDRRKHLTILKVLLETKQKLGEKNGYRSSSWYKDYPWLTLCITTKKAFCFYCRLYYEQKELCLSKNIELAFIRDGFSIWKKAIQRFDAHQRSAGHKESIFKFSRQLAPGINEQINTELKKLQQMRRSMLLKQLSSLRMLLRQGLAIRGHDRFDGNLEQLLQLRSEDDKDLKIWSEYLSHDIVNECISLLGNTLLRELLCSIRETSIFSIMADETRDISNQEKLSICIHWIDSEFSIHEDLIGINGPC